MSNFHVHVLNCNLMNYTLKVSDSIEKKSLKCNFIKTTIVILTMCQNMQLWAKILQNIFQSTVISISSTIRIGPILCYGIGKNSSINISVVVADGKEKNLDLEEAGDRVRWKTH